MQSPKKLPNKIATCNAPKKTEVDSFQNIFLREFAHSRSWLVQVTNALQLFSLFLQGKIAPVFYPPTNIVARRLRIQGRVRGFSFKNYGGLWCCKNCKGGVGTPFYCIFIGNVFQKVNGGVLFNTPLPSWPCSKRIKKKCIKVDVHLMFFNVQFKSFASGLED